KEFLQRTIIDKQRTNRMIGKFGFVATMGWVALAVGAARPEPPPLKEVLDVVRANAKGISEQDFNRAAVDGFLAQLDNRAWLLDANQANETVDTNTPTLAATAVFDDSFGYVRVGRIAPGLAAQFSRALSQLN